MRRLLLAARTRRRGPRHPGGLVRTATAPPRRSRSRPATTSSRPTSKHDPPQGQDQVAVGGRGQEDRVDVQRAHDLRREAASRSSRARRTRLKGTYSVRFTKTGTFKMICAVHPDDMKMTRQGQALSFGRLLDSLADGSRLSAAKDPRRRRQARPRRPRPRREDHRPRAARRGHGGHLHRPPPDARSRSPRPCSRRTPTRSGCRSSPART